MFAATLLASVIAAPRLAAQAGLGHVEDASIAPKGLLRLRAISAWSRSDSRFTAAGVEPLGADFTADTLGPAKFPALAAIQSRVSSVSGAPFALMMGRARLGATAREEIIPFALEYGVTNRFAIGVTVPVVRRRVAMQFRLDTTGSVANVGPNPGRTSSTAAANNATLQTELTSAMNQLQTRLNGCIANSAGPNCTAILAQAPGLLQSSQSFSTDVAALYGFAVGTGMAFVPMTSSAAQTAVGLRISGFNSSYQSLLGTSATLIQAIPAGAGGPAGAGDFQSFIINDLGRDSLNLQERLGIGDVEVGFKMRVLDVPRSKSRQLGLQLSAGSMVRLPTGSRQSPSDVVDLSLGDGSVIVDSRAIFDARAGRFGLLAAGQFAVSVHDKDTTAAAARNSRWTEVQVAPRWHLSEALAIHGAYSLRSADKFGGGQLAGGGLSYSTLSTYRGGPLPIEMRFTHLEAISGDAGRPKFFRDQLELRIYYRLRN